MAEGPRGITASDTPQKLGRAGGPGPATHHARPRLGTRVRAGAHMHTYTLLPQRRAGIFQEGRSPRAPLPMFRARDRRRPKKTWPKKSQEFKISQTFLKSHVAWTCTARLSPAEPGAEAGRPLGLLPQGPSRAWFLPPTRRRPPCRSWWRPSAGARTTGASAPCAARAELESVGRQLECSAAPARRQ